MRIGLGGVWVRVGWDTQPTHQGDTVSALRAVRDYVSGIIGLWAVVDAWNVWECLCGHTVCEWCDGWKEADMMTQYDLPRSQVGND